MEIFKLCCMLLFKFIVQPSLLALTLHLHQNRITLFFLAHNFWKEKGLRMHIRHISQFSFSRVFVWDLSCFLFYLHLNEKWRFSNCVVCYCLNLSSSPHFLPLLCISIRIELLSFSYLIISGKRTDYVCIPDTFPNFPFPVYSCGI